MVQVRRLGPIVGSAMLIAGASCSSGPGTGALGPTTTAAPAAIGATTVPSAAASIDFSLSVLPGLATGPFHTPHTLQLPVGWTAEVWARVPDARIETWTPEGDLLVSEPSDGKVVELAPAGSGRAPTQQNVLSGLTQPQGLAFGRYDGQEVLYVGESDEIDRYQWDGAGVGDRTVIAGHLPDLDASGDDDHRQKDVVVAPGGTVYFNVGSSSNANPDDRTMIPPRATIMAVQPDGSDLHVVETGVRNGEGLAVAPDGVVWTAVNERDNIPYPLSGSFDGVSDAFGEVISSYVDEHPPDEVVPVTPGRDLGWPYCDPDPDLNTPAGSLAGVPFEANASTNPGGHALNCTTLTPIDVGLPAHSAPVGLSFLEGTGIPAPWSGGAVVTVHGSWDRQPPRAPAVLWMAWNSSTDELEPAVTLASGWQLSNGSRWGRPVDTVAGPDGSLYVSDDSAGAIYRLTPPG